MIVETAILCLAAIIVASLTTANAIHKRIITAGDVDAEVRRVLERRRERLVAVHKSWVGDVTEKGRDQRGAWGKAIDEVDDDLIKLARGEFQVSAPDTEHDTRKAKTDAAAFGEPKGTNPCPEGQQRGP